MTELDTALKDLRADLENETKKSRFYDLVLNSTFFVPTLDTKTFADAPVLEEGQVLPLVMESDGVDYMMLFDTKERMETWAEELCPYVEVPGYVLAMTTTPPLHWAMNVGTDYSKQFIPDEIEWLKDAVERCQAAADALD